jgi:cell filamentation protein
MSRKRKGSVSRYDVSGNVEAQYVDAEETVLVNKLGVKDLATLERIEGETLVAAYERLLAEVRTDTPMTCELLLYIHQRIFESLYEWAGRWRTVKISKPGVIWPPPDFLDEAMKQFERTVLARRPASSLQDDEQFCDAAGEIEGEFLAIHPFREGNARTIKLLVDLLALQSNRPLLKYDMCDAGRYRYIDAARAAIRKDYGPMSAMVREALADAMRSTATGPADAGASPR